MSVARRSLRSLVVAGLAGLTIPQAFAHAPSVPAAQLERCAAIAAAAQRLSCYDALAASVVPARAAARSGAEGARSDAMAARSSAAAAPSEASSFGLPPPQLAVPPGPPSIQARLQAVTANPYGDTVVQLDNGQTWEVQQPDAPLWRGESVTIRRAALGSFLMLTSDRRSYRVERLR